MVSLGYMVINIEMRAEAFISGKGLTVAEQYEYTKGDRVRVVQGTLVVPEGSEATVVKVYRDSTDTITAIDILVAPDPAHTQGTRVFPHEIELLR